MGGDRSSSGQAAGGGAAPRPRDGSSAPSCHARRVGREPPHGLGRGSAHRGDDVLSLGHPGLHGAVGSRSRRDGGGARAPRRDHRRAGGVSGRAVPQVHGRGRFDGLGVRVGAAGARRCRCGHPCPASGAVAGWDTSRGPFRRTHGRGRAPRSRLLRADRQPGGAAARTGRRRPGLRIRGDGGACGPAPAGRLRAGRPRSAPVARTPRAGEHPRPQGSRAQRTAARGRVAVSGTAGVRARRPAVLLRARGCRRRDPRAPGARPAAGCHRGLRERQVVGTARRRCRRRTGGRDRGGRARPDPDPRVRAAARGDGRSARAGRRRSVRGALHVVRGPRAARRLHRWTARPARSGRDRRAGRPLREVERPLAVGAGGRREPDPARSHVRRRARAGHHRAGARGRPATRAGPRGADPARRGARAGRPAAALACAARDLGSSATGGRSLSRGTAPAAASRRRSRRRPTRSWRRCRPIARA